MEKIQEEQKAKAKGVQFSTLARRKGKGEEAEELNVALPGGLLEEEGLGLDVLAVGGPQRGGGAGEEGEGERVEGVDAEGLQLREELEEGEGRRGGSCH